MLEKNEAMLVKKPFLFSEAESLEAAKAEAGNMTTLMKRVRHIIFLYLDMTSTPPANPLMRTKCSL